MKRALQLFLLITIYQFTIAQKIPLDYNAILNWPTIYPMPKISNDGKYVLYTVKRNEHVTLFLKSTEIDLKIEYEGEGGLFQNSCFTEDSHYAVFMKAKDSLCIFDLVKKRETQIIECSSYLLPENGTCDWIACRSKKNQVCLLNLFTGKRFEFSNVNNFLFSNSGKVFLFVNGPDRDATYPLSINWLDLTSLRLQCIWHGNDAKSFTFSESDDKLAFCSEMQGGGDMERKIFYYSKELDSAQELVGIKSKILDERFQVCNSGFSFSPKADKLFFYVCNSKDTVKPVEEFASLDVWSYKDDVLQSEQLQNSDNERRFKCVIELNTKKVNQLEFEENDYWYLPNLNHGQNDEFLLLTVKEPKDGTLFKLSENKTYLIDTKDGSRRLINSMPANKSWFSPKGKYVYWYDSYKHAYYTYNIATAKITNVSVNVKTPLYKGNFQNVAQSPYGVAVWVGDDESFLVYDQYDIWELDAEARQPPVNVTNGYGQKNKIVLRLVYKNYPGSFLRESALKRDSNIFLCGFNEISKYNGFFKTRLNSYREPAYLIMSPDTYYFSGDFTFPAIQPFMLKAKYSEAYLLIRMSDSEFPNMQFTRDFRSFQKMSTLSPQKSYNWLSSELYTFKSLNGQQAKGILYKPENFDPQKKYPIIFHFYEQLSNQLYQFPTPEFCPGEMNIPLFVSRGYLVFCPDIYYSIGNPGQSAYDFVISAAHLMSKKTWVDSKKMAIQGHSFGAYEVNYILTRTNIFAAASSSAGTSDLISAYGSLRKNIQSHYEKGQMRMGTTPWDNQEAYIKNSPVYSADKVSTPLLIMHNKDDRNVPWSQGVEFFTALRRLKKVVWLLQYDDGGHELDNQVDQIDFTTRILQFFDHYLKENAAPQWMTKGIPAKAKRKENGLKLDSLGRCFPDCQICQKWNNIATEIQARQ
jgi:dienelactone hydrolase